jgi:hypothetical protein
MQKVLNWHHKLPFFLAMTIASSLTGDEDYTQITRSLFFGSAPMSSCILFNIVECVLMEDTEFFTIAAGPATGNITIFDGGKSS